MDTYILAKDPLDERSAQRRDLYLTTHNTHKRQTSIPPVGFEPAIPASERPQIHASDCAATGIERIQINISIGPQTVSVRGTAQQRVDALNLCYQHRN
jgi:hypothetical protein